MTKIFNVILLFLMSCSIQSCGGSANATSPETQVEYEILHESDHNEFGEYTNKSSVVIGSQAEYEEELLKRTSDLTKSVNFDEETILLVDMGVRGTGGPSINLVDLVEYDDYILATIELDITPGALQWVTNPYKFIKIKSFRKEILVVEQLSTDN